jgi:hypothetical protein
MLRALRVLTVGVDRTNGAPTAVMSEHGGHRILPVPLDLVGATLITDECRSSRAPDHGLLADVVRAVGRSLEHVELVVTRSGPYRARLVFDGDTRVDGPAGDAIAVALHSRVPIVVENAVLDREALTAGAGLDVQDGLATAGVAADDEADQVRRFQQFLDTVDVADFLPTA